MKTHTCLHMYVYVHVHKQAYARAHRALSTWSFHHEYSFISHECEAMEED